MVDKIWYNMEELIGGSEERGINRNILECKVEARRVINLLPFSINRNILECKDCQMVRRRAMVDVLIETYWNVKYDNEKCKSGNISVLIETYWNVKTF